MEDTMKLLQACHTRCRRTAIRAATMKGAIKQEKLRDMVLAFSSRHVGIDDECRQMLRGLGKGDPACPVADALLKAYTLCRLTLRPGPARIAECLLHHCNTTVKTLSQTKNRYKEASEHSVRLADELLALQKDFIGKLLAFL
ncbi:MAG: hypothetical protein WDA00_06170 [Eubacteriales bacterium]